MENSVLLTLERLAAIKCTTLMWNENNVICAAKIVKDDDWDSLEMKVIQNAKKLPDARVAKLIKRKIIDLVKAIGTEVCAYKVYNSYIFGEEFSKRSLNYLRWTPQGTIDREKSAKALLKDETIDVLSRFKLACTYCLEDEVSRLRNRVPEIYIRDFKESDVPSLLRQYHLTEFMKTGGGPNLRLQIEKINNSLAFRMTSISPNTLATSYFLNKMKSVEKAEYLVETTEGIAETYDMFKDKNVIKQWFFALMFSLLLAMNKEQRMEIYGKCARIILKGFRDWPMQDLFLTFSNEIVPFLTGEESHEILHTLIDKWQSGYRDHDYVALFCAFWEQITGDCKQYILKDFCGKTGLLPKLLKISDLNSILVLLKHAKNNLKTRVFKDHLVSALVVNEESDTALLKPMIRSIYPRDVCEKYRDNFSEQQFGWLTREIYGDVARRMRKHK